MLASAAMRPLALFVVVFGIAAQAHAGALGVPPLSFDAPSASGDALEPLSRLSSSADTARVVDGDVELARRTYQVPNRYAFAFDETRALWFAAGASAAISLGAHVLIGLPSTLVAAVVVIGWSAGNPIVALPLFALALGGYLVTHAVATGVISTLVFNGMSDVYEGRALPTIAGHLAGDALGVGVSALMFGAGGAVMGALSGLAAFTGSAGWETVLVLTVLGSMPAIVIAGIALVCAPAVLGAWALAVTAEVAEGYAPAPDWKQRIHDGDGALGDGTLGDGPRASARDTKALPLVRFAFDAATPR